MAAIALVDMDAPRLDAGLLRHLGDDRGQRVAAIEVAVQRRGVQDELAALGLVTGVTIETLQPNS